MSTAELHHYFISARIKITQYGMQQEPSRLQTIIPMILRIHFPRVGEGEKLHAAAPMPTADTDDFVGMISARPSTMPPRERSTSDDKEGEFVTEDAGAPSISLMLRHVPRPLLHILAKSGRR